MNKAFNNIKMHVGNNSVDQYEEKLSEKKYKYK